MKSKNIVCLTVVTVVLASTACMLFYRLEQCRQSLRQAELSLRYERIVQQLLIPAEALYCDHHNPEHGRLFRQICDLRKEYFPKQFLPYGGVVRPGWATIFVSEQPGNIWNGAFEHYWLNEAPRGLSDLAFQIEQDTELGRYIQSQAQVKDNAMVSLTERLLGSPHPRHRIGAARLLLALGGRDKKVMDVVKAFAEEKMCPASSDKGTIMVYSSERDEALKLDAKYKLDILNHGVNKPTSEIDRLPL